MLLVPMEGLEPPHSSEYQILSLARLPIPPHRPPSCVSAGPLSYTIVRRRRKHPIHVPVVGEGFHARGSRDHCPLYSSLVPAHAGAECQRTLSLRSIVCGRNMARLSATSTTSRSGAGSLRRFRSWRDIPGAFRIRFWVPTGWRRSWRMNAKSGSSAWRLRLRLIVNLPAAGRHCCRCSLAMFSMRG